MRRLERAAAAAGTGASADDVAKHYLCPALARHFSDIASLSFLKDLTTAAELPAVSPSVPPALPDPQARTTIAEAARVAGRPECCGCVAVIIMSAFLGISIGLAGYGLPLLGGGLVAYLVGYLCGERLFQSGQRFAQAVEIAQATLAYERTKTDYWQRLHWRDLELEVTALFQRMGYTARTTPASNDKGVDVIAERPNEKIVVQCKQYAKPAQRNLVSELLGVMTSESASRGILICTGGFTRGAEEYAAANGVELWDLADVATHHERNA